MASGQIHPIAAIGAVYAVWCVAWPLALGLWHPMAMCLALWVAGGCAGWCYSRAPWRTPAGWWILLAAGLLLTALATADVAWYTVRFQALDSMPRLSNWDSYCLWADARWHASEGFENLAASSFRPAGTLPGAVSAGLWALLGKSVLWPMALNVFLMLLTVVMAGGTAWKVSGNSKIVIWTMGLTSAVAYLMAMGTVLQKEPWAILGVTVGAYGLTAAWSRPGDLKWLGWLLLAVVICDIGRASSLGFLAAGAVMVAFRWHGPRKQWAALGLVLLAIGIALFINWRMIDHTPVVLTDTASSIGEYARPQDHHDAYNSLLGDYWHWPLWRRLAWLPVSAGVQFFIPFPWNVQTTADFGPGLIYGRMGMAWYVIGGLVVWYFIVGLRRSNSGMGRLMTWAAAMWLLPAVVTAGMVSRYGLALVPTLCAGAAWVVVNAGKDRRLWWWMAGWCAMVVAALIYAWVRQRSMGL